MPARPTPETGSSPGVGWLTMQTLFDDLGIATGRSLLHRQHFVDLGTASVYSSQGRSTPIMREFQGPARAVGVLRQHRPPRSEGYPSLAGCRRAIGVDFEVQRHMMWPESKEAR